VMTTANHPGLMTRGSPVLRSWPMVSGDLLIVPPTVARCGASVKAQDAPRKRARTPPPSRPPTPPKPAARRSGGPTTRGDAAFARSRYGNERQGGRQPVLMCLAPMPQSSLSGGFRRSGSLVDR
jgi:hypothetical protein